MIELHVALLNSFSFKVIKMQKALVFIIIYIEKTNDDFVIVFNYCH